MLLGGWLVRFSRGDFPFPTILPSVSGFILDTNFYGSIFVNHDIYYVDPSKVFPTQMSLQYVRKWNLWDCKVEAYAFPKVNQPTNPDILCFQESLTPDRQGW